MHKERSCEEEIQYRVSKGCGNLNTLQKGNKR